MDDWLGALNHAVNKQSPNAIFLFPSYNRWGTNKSNESPENLYPSSGKAFPPR